MIYSALYTSSIPTLHSCCSPVQLSSPTLITYSGFLLFRPSPHDPSLIVLCSHFSGRLPTGSCLLSLTSPGSIPTTTVSPDVTPALFQSCGGDFPAVLMGTSHPSFVPDILVSLRHRSAPPVPNRRWPTTRRGGW
jgi:hypothetical protein